MRPLKFQLGDCVKLSSKRSFRYTIKALQLIVHNSNPPLIITGESFLYICDLPHVGVLRDGYGIVPREYRVTPFKVTLPRSTYQIEWDNKNSISLMPCDLDLVIPYNQIALLDI